MADNIQNGTSKFFKYFFVAVLGYFTLVMVIKRAEWCFVDWTNLLFHESGHIIFGFFGTTIHFLGGTMGQLMWPVGLFGYFLLKGDLFSASVCSWWFGENLVNISKYINDARAMVLPLVGGGIHDWNFLLDQWNLLAHDHTIAAVIFFLGAIMMVGSLLWSLTLRPPTLFSDL